MPGSTKTNDRPAVPRTGKAIAFTTKTNYYEFQVLLVKQR